MWSPGRKRSSEERGAVGCPETSAGKVARCSPWLLQMAWLTWVGFLSPWQLLSWGTFGAELGFGPCAGEANLSLERVSLVLITVKQTSIIVNQWSLSLQVNYRWAQTALAVIMPVSGVQCGRGRFSKMKRAVLCVSRWPSWLPHSHEDGLYWSISRRGAAGKGCVKGVPCKQDFSKKKWGKVDILDREGSTEAQRLFKLHIVWWLSENSWQRYEVI